MNEIEKSLDYYLTGGGWMGKGFESAISYA